MIDFILELCYHTFMKAAVIGAGKLGSIHLRIYKELAGISKLYGVDSDVTKHLADDRIEWLSDYRKLEGKINLASIATPTCGHFEVAKFFLERRVPVLVEKPITSDLGQADKLIKLAKKNKTLLFVGHVERYNSAYQAVKENIKNPLFIECNRLSPFPNRSLDISVVSDLMIHDLDIILDLVKDKIKKIDAKGVKVLSSSADIANARVTFKNGCVANITASRISAKRERKIRVFMHDCYVSLDYANQEVQIYRKTNAGIEKKDLLINKDEPLKQEIADFLRLVRSGDHNIEHAQKAANALGLALKIERML